MYGTCLTDFLDSLHVIANIMICKKDDFLLRFAAHPSRPTKKVTSGTVVHIEELSNKFKSQSNSLIWVFMSLCLIKHYAMKRYGKIDV
jgi:hypothetical protein